MAAKHPSSPMNTTNPYESTRLKSAKEAIKATTDFGRNACPLCGHPVSRWSVLNTIQSKACDGCDAKLWLEMPLRYLCLLGLLGLVAMFPTYWTLRFPDSVAIAPGSKFFLIQVVVLPISILFVSYTLRFRFGKVVAAKRSTG